MWKLSHSFISIPLYLALEIFNTNVNVIYKHGCVLNVLSGCLSALFCSDT